ncbi:MAG: hypothetical protein JW818_04380, partial [Pirellulales bacterium]|nr:hypothetical protein [Pirellulales bacterium]
FLRAAVLGGLIAAWLLIPAPEPVVVFTVQALLVAPVILLARRWRERSPERRWIQFTIRDMLLLTVLVAVVTTAAVNAPKGLWTSWDSFQNMVIDFKNAFQTPGLDPWIVYMLAGALAAVEILLAVWLVFGRCRVWIRAIVLLVIFATVGFLAFDAVVATWFTSHKNVPWLMSLQLSARAVQRVWWIAGVPIAIIPMTVWLAVFAWWRGRSSKQSWQNKLSWMLLLLISALVFLPPLCAYAVLVYRPAIPDAPAFEPNGYDKLITLGEEFYGDFGPGNPHQSAEEKLNAEQLKLFVAKHGDVFVRAHEVLSHECRVPLEYTREYAIADVVSMSTSHAHGLASGLLAKARLEFLNGEHGRSMDHCLDTIQLGQAVGRGGLPMDWIMGRLIEIRALNRLHIEARSFLPARRRELLRELKSYEQSGDTLAEAMHREYVLANRAFGWYGRLTWLIKNWNERSGPRSWISEKRAKHLEVPYCLLPIELALANYISDHGRYPESLDDLVPNYLTEVPEDPFNDGPPVYRRTGPASYQLYSVGPNGLDDGQKQSFSDNEPRYDSQADDIWFWQKDPDAK